MAAEGDASPRRAPARPARNEMMKMRPCMYDVRVDADGGQSDRQTIRYKVRTGDWCPPRGPTACVTPVPRPSGMCRVSSRGVIPVRASGGRGRVCTDYPYRTRPHPAGAYRAGPGPRRRGHPLSAVCPHGPAAPARQN